MARRSCKYGPRRGSLRRAGDPNSRRRSTRCRKRRASCYNRYQHDALMNGLHASKAGWNQHRGEYGCKSRRHSSRRRSSRK